MDFFYDYDLETTEDNSLSLPTTPAPTTLSSTESGGSALQKEDFTKKFSNRFSLLSNLNRKSNTLNQHSSPGDNERLSNALAEKYAKLSIDLLEQSEREITGNVLLAHVDDATKKTNVLSEKLNKILNNPSMLSNKVNISLAESNDSSIKNSLHLLENKNYLSLSGLGSDNIGEISKDYNLLIQPGLLGSVSRRKLRNNIHNEYLSENLYALRKFQPVYTNLLELNRNLENLTNINDQLLKEFQNLNTFNEKNFKQNENFNLTRLKKLKAEKDEIAIKKSLLLSFKKEFQLNEYEKYLLESPGAEIREDFYDSFNKAEEIYNKCYLLLSMTNPKIGLDIMSQVKNLIDRALNNVNYYVNKKLSHLNELKKDDFVNLKQCIKLILKSVSKDDVLSAVSFQEGYNLLLTETLPPLTEVISSNNTLKELIKNIKVIKTHSLSSEFETLMRENETQLFSSLHDPMRYVGDLLASVHSLIVSEKEVLDLLFKEDDDANSPYTYNGIINVNELELYILNMVVGILSTPLKLRLEQVVRSQSDVFIINHLYESLELYKMMFSKQLSSSDKTPTNETLPAVIETLATLQTSLQERIFTILHSKINYISGENSHVLTQKIDQYDLQPPDWFIDYLSGIQGVLRSLSHSTTLNNNSSFMNFDKELIDKLVSLIIDKPVEFVETQVENSDLLPDCASIVKINCLDLISSKILTVTLLNEKYENLNEALLRETEELTSTVYNLLLEETKLTAVEKEINKIYPIEEFIENEISNKVNVNYMMYQPVVKNSETHFNTTALHDINVNLQVFIPDVLSYPTFINITQISSPMISSRVTESAFLKFVNLYKIFHTLVVIEFNNATAGNEKILTWNEVEVATLLGVEKAYMQQQVNAAGVDKDIKDSSLNIENALDSDIEP